MENYIAYIAPFFLGIALSAASGFRVFVPLLISNLAVKFGLFSVAQNFAWMGSTQATIILAIATILELSAYYVPLLDNLLDSIAAPAAVVAGTLLTTSFLKIDDPVIQWGLGIIAGGGVAGTIQAGTSLLRLGSTKFTGGLGNSTLATVENGLSFGISFFSLWLPIIMGVLVLIFVFWIINKLVGRFKKEKVE